LEDHDAQTFKSIVSETLLCLENFLAAKSRKYQGIKIVSVDEALRILKHEW
jgi:hypothetical protein